MVLTSLVWEERNWLPAQSPDHNPIQHLEHRLRASTNHPAVFFDLTDAVVVEWEQIPAAWCQNLVESLKPEE